MVNLAKELKHIKKELDKVVEDCIVLKEDGHLTEYGKGQYDLALLHSEHIEKILEKYNKDKKEVEDYTDFSQEPKLITKKEFWDNGNLKAIWTVNQKGEYHGFLNRYYPDGTKEIRRKFMDGVEIIEK